MAKFEQYKPKLRPGKAIPHGQKIIYETEAPFDQIVLPIDMVDFVLLCDGRRSVGEIVELIYHKRGNVQFRTLFKTLVYLKDRGFLQNPDELEIPQQNDQKDQLSFIHFHPLWEFPVGQRIFNEKDRPGAFYVFSMLVILGAILNLNLLSTEWISLSFLTINGSYFYGALFVFTAASLLLSAKNLFKCMLLLFLTGRAYNFSLAFNGIAFYFRVKSDSLFLVMNRLYLVLFHMAVVLCYFPIVSVLSFLFPDFPYYTQTMSLAFVLMLFDLNPFQESELSYLLKSFFNDDTIAKISSYMKERPLLSLIHPFESNKDYNLYFFFSHYALLWSAVFVYSFYVGSREHFLSLTTTMKTSSMDERLLAMLVATFIVTSLCIAVVNAYRLIHASLVVPISTIALKYIRQKKSQPITEYKHKDILRILEELPMFNFLSPELLNMIVSRSHLKAFRTKSPVIIQGDPGTQLYVLLTGRLQVRKRGSNSSIVLSEIHPISIFGETAVIEDCKRTADVMALEKSIVLEVPAKMLREVASENHYVHELEAFRNAILVNQFFASAPVFKELPDNVRQNFIMRGRIESYKKEHIVFKQGDLGDGFYLLLRGTVGVMVNGRPVSKIQQGGFFGEISMIADVPRTGTIYAYTDVDVLKINREAFWEILSLDIRIAMFIESVGEMRVKEDVEILSDNKPSEAS